MTIEPQLRSLNSIAHEPMGFCPHCNYPMDAGTCPECGRDVPKPRRKKNRYWGRRLLKFGAPAAVLVCLYLFGPYCYLYYCMPRDRLFEISHQNNRLRGLAYQVIRDQKMARGRLEWSISGAMYNEITTQESHEWAGQYFIPDPSHRIGNVTLYTGGGQLTLSPGGKYLWCESTCQGCSNLVDWGKIEEIRRDRLVLVSDHPDPKFGPRYRRTLLRVRWNGRHYLYPAELESTLVEKAAASQPAAALASDELWSREPDRSVALNGPPDTPYRLKVQVNRSLRK